MIISCREARKIAARTHHRPEKAVDGDSAFALSDLVLSGFHRVVTHPRVFVTPSPVEKALEFIHGMRERAATDGDYARLPGLSWMNPLVQRLTGPAVAAPADRGTHARMGKSLSGASARSLTRVSPCGIPRSSPR